MNRRWIIRSNEIKSFSSARQRMQGLGGLLQKGSLQDYGKKSFFHVWKLFWVYHIILSSLGINNFSHSLDYYCMCKTHTHLPSSFSIIFHIWKGGVFFYSLQEKQTEENYPHGNRAKLKWKHSNKMGKILQSRHRYRIFRLEPKASVCLWMIQPAFTTNFAF